MANSLEAAGVALDTVWMLRRANECELYLYMVLVNSVATIIINNVPKNRDEKFYIKDKHGCVLEKSSDLLNLIEKTKWINLRAVK